MNIQWNMPMGLGAAPAANAAPVAPGVVDLTKLKAGSAASFAGEDWNKFMTDYGPLIERQMASLDSTKMVDRAMKDAAVVPNLMSEAADRAALRRGGKTFTQGAASFSARQLRGATESADIINNARMDQRERNTDAAYKMSGLGTDIYQMGLDNVRESEGLATQRRMNNANAKQQAKSNAVGLGMTALAAFAL